MTYLLPSSDRIPVASLTAFRQVSPRDGSAMAALSQRHQQRYPLDV